MGKVLGWIWRTGIVSTFLVGFFVVLPIAITVAIMAWMGGLIKDWLGPGSPVGDAMRRVGLQFATDPIVATLLGWLVVIAAIWLLGALTKSIGRNKVDNLFNSVMERIPLVNKLYKPVAQVIDMFKKEGQSEMQGMCVVYCAFGPEHGGGFLGLLASEGMYHFNGKDCNVVFFPTAPVPMTGGILFFPSADVYKLDMTVEDMMQIYLSIGVMADKVIPEQYVSAGKPG